MSYESEWMKKLANDRLQQLTDENAAQKRIIGRLVAALKQCNYYASMYHDSDAVVSCVNRGMAELGLTWCDAIEEAE